MSLLRFATILSVALIASQALAVSAPSVPSTLLMTPEAVLRRMEERNPELASARARADAESALVWSASWLDSPRIGLMREQNLTNMQVTSGPMSLWSVSQEIKFPLKYVASGMAQASRAEASRLESQDKELELRQRALTAYFNYYSASRISALLAAQREALREIARAAEARRATGSVPQQDEMKAHVEQTRIENEILLQEQEVVELESQLRKILNLDPAEELTLPDAELPVPKAGRTESVASVISRSRSGSKAIQASQAQLGQARSEGQLAALSFAPDFMLSYRRAYVNSPPDAFAVGIEATIPLWFFAKQIPEVRAANARTSEAEHRLESLSRETEADARTLSTRVESYSKLLSIYETSLIPQSINMLNSSRAAYSAGRTTFIELLDSERSLYSNRIAYYQNLAKFIESLTRLERVLGSSISNLPFIGGSS